jgi:hypothetical protein
LERADINRQICKHIVGGQQYCNMGHPEPYKEFREVPWQAIILEVLIRLSKLTESRSCVHLPNECQPVRVRQSGFFARSLVASVICLEHSKAFRIGLNRVCDSRCFDGRSCFSAICAEYRRNRDTAPKTRCFRQAA